jgi:drug/metabolite transporter (DMT)-like permease
VPALAITVGHFAVIFIPALVVLFFSGFFSDVTLQSPQLIPALGYLVILAVLGTGLAKVLFNTLVQLSTPVFASSVTYTIPIIALVWGMLDGEQFTLLQLGATAVILLGVLLTNKS